MKKFLSVICILALCLSLCACGKTEPVESKPEESISESVPESVSESEPEESKTEKKTLALCIGSVSHPVHRVIQYGFIKTANELGYEAKIFGLDDGSMMDLRAEWNTLLNDRDIQGVAVWTGDDSCYDLLKTYRENGMHVVVPYFPHDYKKTHEFIEFNPVGVNYTDGADGAASAKFMLQKLKERGITEGVIGITQTSAAATDVTAVNGFVKAIDGSGFTVADLIFQGPEINEATYKGVKYLTDNPDMVAVFSAAGDGARAWTNAKKETGKDDLFVIAYVYEDPIDEITVDGFNVHPIYEAGVEAAKALAALNEGKTYTEAEWNPPLPVNIVDKEGYAEYEARYNEAQEYFAK